MDSLIIVLQVLGIVSLVAVIIFFSFATFILIMLASKLRDLFELINTLKQINVKVKKLQSEIPETMSSFVNSVPKLIRDFLTRLVFRK